MLCLGVGEFMVRIPAIVTCTAAPRHGFCRWLQWEFPRSKEIPPGEGAKMTYDYLSSCRAPRTCVYNPNCALRGGISGERHTPRFPGASSLPSKEQGGLCLVTWIQTFSIRHWVRLFLYLILLNTTNLLLLRGSQFVLL